MWARENCRCGSCDDTGIVCEEHPNRPWETGSANQCQCGGAGMPCPQCTTPVPQFQGHSIHDNFTPLARKH